MTNAHRFNWYQLRTTEPSVAENFYAQVLGFRTAPSSGLRAFHVDGKRVGELVDLPSRAHQRGAPAHWLPHVHTRDVEGIARRVVAQGGQRLGPTEHTIDGQQTAALKDAQGAPFAVSTREGAGADAAIAWHELNTIDEHQALLNYGELFGWVGKQRVALGPPVGDYQTFAWDEAGAPAGGMVNSARQAHVHTHWLLYMRTDDLPAALDKVRALGGHVVAGPMTVPSGEQVALCEDPAGAAFALRQPLAS